MGGIEGIYAFSDICLEARFILVVQAHVGNCCLSFSAQISAFAREEGGGREKKGDTGLMPTKKKKHCKEKASFLLQSILLNKDGTATKSAQNASHPLLPGGRERRIRSHLDLGEEGDSFIGHVGTL